MRKFYLYTADGERIDLNDKRGGVLIFNVAGLGAKLPSGIADIGNGFFKLTSPETVPQQNILGDIVIAPGNGRTAYLNYSDFCARILHGGLVLGYRPEESAPEFKRKVAVDYLTKTELEAGVLRCPVCFRTLTPWYLVTDAVFDMTPTVTSSAKIFSAKVTPRGQIPAAFKIVMTGSSSTFSPDAITLYDQTGTKLEGINMQRIINLSERFEFSTEYGDSFFRSARFDDLSNNMYAPYGDEAYFRIPTGGTYSLQVQYPINVTLPTAITAKIINYFLTV